MKALRIAALLASTALVHPAQAEPISSFIIGLQVGAAGITAGYSAAALGFSAAAGAGIAVGAFAASALGRVVIGLAATAAVNALVPQPGFDVNIPTLRPSDQMVNAAQPISYMKTIYGRRRTGGPLAFYEDKADRRYFVPVFAAHRIEGVVQWYIDEWTVGIDPAVTDFSQANLIGNTEDAQYTAPVEATGGITGPGRIELFDGAPGQAVNAGLAATFDEVTAAFDFEGLAGAVCWAARRSGADFTKTYPRGREWVVAPLIDGKWVYDPRTEVTAYSDNAALIIADWVVSQGQEVDWEAVAIEADVSYVPITDKDGVAAPRYTLTAENLESEDYETQRARLAIGCDAYFFERPDGKVGFYVGRYIAPDVTLTDADVAACTVTSGGWASDRPTEIAPIFVDPDNAWREASAGVWVADATARRVREEPQYIMVSNHRQVAQLAKRRARARRPEWQLQGTIGMIGYNLMAQRFFALDYAALGIDAVFEIQELVRTGPVTFEIKALSVTSEDFDFDPATEQFEKPALGGDVDGGFTTPDVTGVTATATAAASVTVTWTDQPDYLWQQVRLRPSGDTAWTAFTVQEGSSYVATGLADGVEYEVQVRNGIGGLFSSPSDWKPGTPLTVTVVANAVAPAAVTGLSATGGAGEATVSWTAPNDPNYAGARVWRGTDAVLANATLVRTEYGAPNTSDSWDDTGLAADDYWYWVAPINASGIEGAVAGPQTVTVT